MQFRAHVSLAPLTTFSIGGEARWFADVDGEEALLEALVFAKAQHIPFHILAGGSNTIFADEGFNGLVIHLKDRSVQHEGELVTCSSGASLLQVIRKAAARGLGGMEKLAGIPGSIGGAVRGNAGAFGVEIQDVIESVWALDMGGMTHRFDAAACKFGYRDSMFKHDPTLIITRVQLRFQPSRAIAVERAIADIIAERERKHIQNIKSAGSFFINPVASDAIRTAFEHAGSKSRGERVPAGWLLERAGMRGVCVGGATASEHHANYFVNNGDATACDVRALAQQAKEKVFARDGILLQEEVTVV